LALLLALMGCAKTPAGSSPPPAPATGATVAPVVTAQIATASTPVPVAGNAFVSGSVECPPGSDLVGGGWAVVLSDGRQSPPSLHLTAGFPTAPRSWTVAAGTGKQPVARGVAQQFALCRPGASTAPQIVSTTVPGPLGAGATTRATAVCPAGTVLTGGGARASEAVGDAQPAPAALHLIGSLPTTPAGAAVLAGVAQSWTAVAQNGGMPSPGASTTAFAICVAAGTIPPTRVASTQVAGPVAPGGANAMARASCPAGTGLVGGGAMTGYPNGTAPQGVHLTASYPVTASAGSFPRTWTAGAETGNMPAFGGTTTGFALCAG